MTRWLVPIVWLFLAFFAGAVCANAAPAGDTAALQLHVLNRLAFGPSQADLEALRKDGVDGWIEQQLHPEAIPEPATLAQRLSDLETTNLNPTALFEQYGPPLHPGEKPDPAAIKAARERSRIIFRQAIEARLIQAVWSPRQLQQVLTEFWFNHFNVFGEKGLDHLWVGNYEAEAVRPHVLGHFRDLLAATVHHPAMQFYLDNFQNVAPGTGRKNGTGGLNENYARELMELHTLGVDGGYTQDDVVALARILTGWTLEGLRHDMAANRKVDDGTAVQFDPHRHDFGPKLFLGHQIAGSGAGELDQAIDILAGSPATAHHLSYQLAQYFVADEPPASLVDRLSREWQATNGDIRAVLGLLFKSPEFRAADNDGAKFKTPYEFVVSSIRATNVPVTNFMPLFATLRRLGEPLYLCLTPDGYKDTSAAWLNPDALVLRANYATALATGHLKLDEQAADPVAFEPVEALLRPVLSQHTLDAIASQPAPMRSALLLGSPDFMRR